MLAILPEIPLDLPAPTGRLARDGDSPADGAGQK